ncbi:MAG: hypothetical protein GY778_19095 [bacterium]|nr:hypothetical protein [bacterium]
MLVGLSSLLTWSAVVAYPGILYPPATAAGDAVASGSAALLLGAPDFSILTSHFSLLTSPFSILISQFSIPSSHFSLLTSHFVVLALPLVHPGVAAAGLAAAAIPIIIHLITRRRARRVPWAAMGFLLAANRRSLRRVRFEQIFLLALRTAVLILIGLAIARPFVPAGAALGLGEEQWHRILLIDNSLSATAAAAASERGEPGTSAGGLPAEPVSSRPPAAAAALALLEGFRANDAISLITLAEPAHSLVARGSYDRREVRGRVSAAAGTQRRADLAGGLAEALELLDDSPAAPENRAVYVISDQAANTWTADEETVALARQVAQEAKLLLVPTERNPRGNRAITELRCIETLASVGLPIRVAATVANFDTVSAHGLRLQVSRGERIVRRLELDPLEPGARREVVFSIAVERPGIHAIKVRLEGAQGDALPVDDVRHLSIEVAESLPVLLVDGRPGAGAFAGETGYLAAALAPAVGTGRKSLLVPKTITEWELPAEALSDYRLIVLANVQQLEQELWQRLEAFVRAGGGLAIFLGDTVNADNYTRLGYADGRGLLPGRLGRTVGDAGDRSTFVRLRPDTFTHPILADFAAAHQSGLFLKGRVYHYLSVEPDPAAATVLLAYTDGQPAIVERSFGSGRVCLITTSANMAWNNLAARGDYVSLCWGLTSYLCSDPTASRNVRVGREIAERLSPEAARDIQMQRQSARITGPDAAVGDGRLRATDDGYELRFGPIDRAGLYTVGLDEAFADTRQIVFAAQLDPLESDLAVMDEPGLRSLLKCPVVYLADDDPAGARFARGGSEELAGMLKYAVLLLLVCEVWFTMRFATRQR